jgi:hypothetical protein
MEKIMTKESKRGTVVKRAFAAAAVLVTTLGPMQGMANAGGKCDVKSAKIATASERRSYPQVTESVMRGVLSLKERLSGKTVAVDVLLCKDEARAVSVRGAGDAAELVKKSVNYELSKMSVPKVSEPLKLSYAVSVVQD